MFDLLNQFAALTLVSGLMLTLLPDGTLRRTASMVVGLLSLMLWVGGLRSLLTQTPVIPDTYPDVWASTGYLLPLHTPLP